MIPPGHVGQRDVAQRAGVHITTVSLALRDSPRLPEETRRRIQALAEEMGYRPDPMLSALTIYRGRVKRIRHQGTIAWVNPVFRKGQVWRGFEGYHQGAAERCQELGYQLEEFRLSELGSSRLSKILQARNVRGVLLSPQAFNRAHLNFDWDLFSAVTFGFSLTRPRLHLVTNAQYRSARIAVRAMRTHGYRRIGFATTHNNDERTDQNFSSGYLAEQRRFLPQDRIPPLILKDATGKVEVLAVEKWYRQYKPDAVLYHYPPIEDYLTELGVTPRECGWASLSLRGFEKERGLAGIDQNDVLIGRGAVDFVIGMIHRNERGVPAHRNQLLVEGTWLDGVTLPMVRDRPASEKEPAASSFKPRAKAKAASRAKAGVAD